MDLNLSIMVLNWWRAKSAHCMEKRIDLIEVVTWGLLIKYKGPTSALPFFNSARP